MMLIQYLTMFLIGITMLICSSEITVFNIIMSIVVPYGIISYLDNCIESSFKEESDRYNRNRIGPLDPDEIMHLRLYARR